jgi:hypothetical protein
MVFCIVLTLATDITLIYVCIEQSTRKPYVIMEVICDYGGVGTLE